MNRIVVMILMLGMLLQVEAEEKLCYKINKAVIDSNLERAEGLLIDSNLSKLSPEILKKNQSFYLYLSFDTPRYIPYAGMADLFCIQRDDPLLYSCFGDDDGGHVIMRVKKEGVYFKIGAARLSQTTDDPIVYSISGVTDKFVKAEPTSCFRSLDAIVKVDNFKKDEQKEKLIDSLSKLKDIIINDLDYRGRTAIAVGEDNSVATRVEKSRDEFYTGIILYSNDEGVHWKRVYEADIPISSVVLLNDKKAAAVASAAGTGGSIYLTENAGKEWSTVYSDVFLNDIAAQQNTIFAVGYGILKSSDGREWQTLIKGGENEFYAVISVDQKRLVVAGESMILLSKDKGKSWKKAKLPADMGPGVLMHRLYKYRGKLYVRAYHPEDFCMVSSDKGESWEFCEQPQ
jgi:hypothetical protein